MPYSFYNINKTYYNNAVIQYKFPNSIGALNTYTYTFPNGFYAVSDLNNALVLYMISQNQYFTNTTTGNNLYFIQLLTSSTYYANQFILSSVPLAIPSGYAIPTAGFNVNSGTTNSGLPSVAYTPQLVVPSSGSIGTIIGLSAGTYPSVATTTTNNFLSNLTPNATTINSIVCRCDLVNNSCAFPSDILDTFYPSANFGSNISYIPTYEKWIGIQSGIYANMTLTFQDQNFNAIYANDPNVMISLLIRKPKNIFAKSVANPIPSDFIKELTLKQ
jgi:hypothetical protein